MKGFMLFLYTAVSLLTTKYGANYRVVKLQFFPSIVERKISSLKKNAIQQHTQF